MNVFYEYEGIFGRAEPAHLNRAMREFFELAATIRRRLGKQGYLLDKYISSVLDAANATLLHVSADSGLQSGAELRQLILTVMDGKRDYANHPMYERAKEHIEAHPLAYQERQTVLDAYCVALAGDYLEHATQSFAKEQRKAMQPAFDIVCLRDLYRKISATIGGEEQLERLNLLIRQRFLIVTPMAGFLQGLTNDLLYSLVCRDAETSKQVFQLVLDNETEVDAL